MSRDPTPQAPTSLGGEGSWDGAGVSVVYQLEFARRLTPSPRSCPMVGEGEIQAKATWACSMLAEGSGRGYGPVAGMTKARPPLSTKLRLLPARLPRPSLSAVRRRVWVSESQEQDAHVQDPRPSAQPSTHRNSLAAGAKLMSRGGSALRQGLWSAVRAMRRHPQAALGAVRAATRRHKWPPQATADSSTPAVSSSLGGRA